MPRSAPAPRWCSSTPRWSITAPPWSVRSSATLRPCSGATASRRWPRRPASIIAAAPPPVEVASQPLSPLGQTLQKSLMAETAKHPAPPIIDGVAAIADRYDGFILDLWGVMHDGVRAYPGARDCLAALHRRGKRIVILSNAPRRAAQVVVRNAELGIPAELYHGLVTSGEAAWQALHARSDPWHRGLGRHAYCLMPVRDRGLLDGLALAEAGSIAEAGFILNTGVESARERIDDFEPVLAEGVAAGLPMLCANPDLVVIRGGVRELCAGSLAARYETLGGFVHYHGKPHEPIYRLCFEQLGIADRRRILEIGRAAC